VGHRLSTEVNEGYDRGLVLGLERHQGPGLAHRVATGPAQVDITSRTADPFPINVEVYKEGPGPIVTEQGTGGWGRPGEFPGETQSARSISWAPCATGPLTLSVATAIWGVAPSGVLRFIALGGFPTKSGLVWRAASRITRPKNTAKWGWFYRNPRGGLPQIGGCLLPQFEGWFYRKLGGPLPQFEGWFYRKLGVFLVL
jgi:hypothetical protein